MRVAAAFLAAVMASCASSSSPPDMDIEGGPGQDITVSIAGVENSPMLSDREGSRSYVLGIEVFNNSDLPVTVTRIAITSEMSSSAFQIQSRSASFNELIEPGQEHVFEVRLDGRLVREFRPDESRVVAFRVLVRLANGQQYFYSFEGPVRY
jgi:hypothetical protein